MATINRFLIALLGILSLAACQGGGSGSGSGSTGKDPISNAAVDDNTPPVAHAGADFLAPENTTVVLSGLNSYDPDGDAFSYLWRQIGGPAITLSDNAAANPSFLAPDAGDSLVFELVVNDNRVRSAPDAITITITASVDSSNQAPSAHAGQSQIVNIASTVTLNGSGSHDPDGDTLTYSWTQVSGTLVNLSSPDEVNPGFTAPGVPDTLVFSLTVSDGEASSSPATVTITVPPMANNQPPIANAGPDQSVNSNDQVTLNASNSYDPDNNPLSYHWSQTSGTSVVLSSTTARNASFTAPSDSDTLVFSLIVNDGQSDSTSDSITVQVNTSDNNPSPSNQPPIADAGADQTVDGSTLVSLNGAGSSDPDNEPISYHWLQTSGTSVDLSSATASNPSFNAPSDGGTLVFSLVVNDGESDSASDSVTIEVTPVTVNHRPVADAGADQDVDGNTLVTLNGGNSYDPDNDSISYLWVQTGGTAVSMNSTTIGSPEFTTPSESSVLYFSLTVNDGQQNSLTDTVVVTVTATVSNHHPLADAGDDQTVAGNTTVTLNGANSSDPDGDALSFTWLQIAGPEVILSDEAIANPTFIAPAAGGTLGFSLMVNDGQQNALLVDTVTVIVTPVNTVPVANAGVDRYVPSNAVVTLHGSNSLDADGDTLSYRWQQLSGPHAVLSSTQTANPSFSADVDGRLIFSLIVNDGEADSQPDSMVVTVGEIPVTNMKVNDTGITWGGNYPSGNNDSCIGETIDQQDCYDGRDISHGDNSDGRGGFSYLKIAANGTELAHDETEWHCVKDQITGLIWEVKQGGNDIQGDEGLHDADDNFRWYNTDASSNGGGNGFDSIGSDHCSGYTDDDSSTYCNTQAFTARVNAEGYCGYNDWRLPTRKELLSLVDYGQPAPMIDSDYFPAAGGFVWSGTPLALGNDSAWGVLFDQGKSYNLHRANARKVRLVRSEP